MDETGRKLPLVEKVKEHQEPAPPSPSPSNKSRNTAHGESRSPKPKDGEKLIRERLVRPKDVWRKESMEKKPRSGPIVARHSFKKNGNLKVDTGRGYSTLPKSSSLRPTSPNYESPFKRQVVNGPSSPSMGSSSRRMPSTGSFNKGRRPPSPHLTANPEELLKRRLEKVRKSKLYLLQQAGPNSFIIGGGDSGEHRHKVTIGNQSCTCGRGHYCIHILFVMGRVFQLSEHDPLMQVKVLKNFEVESLFRKYESRRKQRLSKTHKVSASASPTTESDMTSSESSNQELGLTFVPTSSETHSQGHEENSAPSPAPSDGGSKMEINCPICLLDLESSEELVHCDNCNNRLHHACMAIWHQLVKKQGELLTCPLCRASWTSTSSHSFEEASKRQAVTDSTDTYNASPNNLGVSPVSGFTDIEPSTLLPRSQPIPSEHTSTTTHWVEMFGEDLIGCLFMKHEWVVRETALRYLSREIVMLLSHPSEQDMTSSAANQSSASGRPQLTTQTSQSQSRIESVLEISCQILTMMMADPVYKVYVASLRSLRTMLSYCSLPDVTKLREYMRPVIRSIVLKCADGNRKTNQLSISTLHEFAKDQEGELAIGKELNIQGQTGLGGCMYVVESCVSPNDTDSVPIQWLNGRLLIMTQLLDEFPTKFSASDVGLNIFNDDVSHHLLSMIEFSAKAIAKSGTQPRILKYSRRVILQCSKCLSVLPGMNGRIRELLSSIEPDMRGKLEKKVVEMCMAAQQAAIENVNRQSAEVTDATTDISEPRVGSPAPSGSGRKKVTRSLTFGSIYPSSHPLPSRLPRPDNAAARHFRRSDSYTEAVYETEEEEESLSNPLIANGGRELSDSTESVEADYIHAVVEQGAAAAASCDDGTFDHERRAVMNDTDGNAFQYPDIVDGGGEGNDADETLTGSALQSSDSEVEEASHRKSPRKLSRSRAVTGAKPRISIRSDWSEDEVEGDGDPVLGTNGSAFDSVDGIPKFSSNTDTEMVVPPLLHSHQSLGFDLAKEGEDDSESDYDEEEPMENGTVDVIHDPTDSESGTDNISKSVTLSVSVDPSDDDAGNLSDTDSLDLNTRSQSRMLPFREYKRGKHMRSKTDPLKLDRDKFGRKSPRYHSDPAHGDSTSSASTPRSPMRSDSPTSSAAISAAPSVMSEAAAAASPDVPSEKVPYESVGVVQVVKPINRSLTFSEPPAKRRLPARPKSMRTSRGQSSQSVKSRLSARSKTASSSVPTQPEPKSSTPSIPSSHSPPALSANHNQPSSSPAVPAVIRALSTPNSPLRSRVKSSTPKHSPPASPPRRRHPQLDASSSAIPLSRSPSPPSAPVTAVVRPQATCMVQSTADPSHGLAAAGAPSPIEISAASPSRPIQRQTSTINMLGASGSGSSDDHKNISDSVYAGDLSDSAMASPYEKPVSFKSEVALFSPRSSGADGNCHCKDEVELEEAIALSKAMEISHNQMALPQVPGLSSRREEETITIHVQPDQTDGKEGQVEYLENIHWKRGMMIGTGAFSTCYQCRDVKTGIIMAVKQISFCRNSESEQDSICKAVIDEIRMMATLNHANIVRILGATQTGAHFNMFVEWMPGGSISHLLERYGAFSEPVITSYTQQVLMGLAYLHDHHILHRDMKGANLLVDSTGKHLRIGDFGACAQLASSMTGAGELKGQLLGTIAFMAPEVLRGEHYGRACDVWSVGCVIIEMVTTKPPWNASNVSNHLKLIFTIASANASPPIPENLPPAIKDIMLRCLEPESKHRPPAKELLQHPLFTRSHYRRR